jgi:hypothetical protein
MLPLPLHSLNIALPIHCLLTATAYSLPIHCLFTAPSLPQYCTAYSLLIHCLHCLFTVSIFHCLFSAYSSSLPSLLFHCLDTTIQLPFSSYSPPLRFHGSYSVAIQLLFPSTPLSWFTLNHGTATSCTSTVENYSAPIPLLSELHINC